MTDITDTQRLAEATGEARRRILSASFYDHWIDYGIPGVMDYVVVKGCPSGILVSPRLQYHPDWLKFISVRDLPDLDIMEIDVSRLRMRPPQLLPVSETDWSDHIIEL